MFNIGLGLMIPRHLRIKNINSSPISKFEKWSNLLEEENFSTILKEIYEDNLNPHESLINGLTPLHIACIQGNSKGVRFLLDLDVDINSQSDIGRTPLDEAIFYKYSNCIIELLKIDLKINQSEQNLLLEQIT